MKIYLKFILIIALGGLFLSGCASQGSYLKLDSSLQKDIRTFDGASYVPLARLCDVYGLKSNLDPYTKVATVEKNGTIVMRSGSDLILVNGAEKRLDRPVTMSDGAVFVPVSFVKTNLGAIADVTARPGYPVVTEEFPRVGAQGVHTIRTVVIDAGHGGYDAGAIGKSIGLKEKDVALAIATRVKNILEENGIRVIMTRSNDTFITLAKRADIANTSGADIFVSIHINASNSRSMLGFECYYLSEATDDNARALEAAENSSAGSESGTVAEHSKGLDKTLWDMKLTENRRESIELANSMCGSIGKSLLTKNRGIRSARFYVLKGSRIPAVLAEVGYISNKYEETKLKSMGYVDKVADALSKGILMYKSEYERTEGFTT